MVLPETPRCESPRSLAPNEPPLGCRTPIRPGRGLVSSMPVRRLKYPRRRWVRLGYRHTIWRPENRIGQKVQSCLICKEPLDEWMIAKDYAFHVNCGLWDSAHDDVQALKLKDDVQKIIRRTDDDSPRSRQKRIGPSEIGDSCARKIAYRLLETPEMNRVRDPWPAVVGTAIH